MHCTGSTATFRHLFRAVGANVDRYRSYPRVVGETGGKGFVLAHASADLEAPTVLQVADPKSWPMTEELFAPVTAAYVYDDAEWDATLPLVDDSTPYGLTGAVFGTDDRAIVEADQALRYTAGNLTINDKPTGAVVGQQPFGGARASGTNDKIGTVWSSIRFLSPRSVKRREG